MRSRVFVPLFVSLLALAGCTRDAKGEMPTPAMLSDALLTITDMPGTWDETQRQAFTQRGAENPSIDPSIWCPGASNVTKNLVKFAGEAGADVEMHESGTPDLRRMMRLQAWANDDVKSYFRDAREAVRICDGKTFTDSSGVSSTMVINAGHSLGDESINWTQTIQPPSGADKDKLVSVSRTTIARFGDVIMVLQIGDAVTEGQTSGLAEAKWWSIVSAAGERLHNLSEQVHD